MKRSRQTEGGNSDEEEGGTGCTNERMHVGTQETNAREERKLALDERRSAKVEGFD